MKLKENKYDPISEKFRNLLNKVYKVELSIQEATIFIRNYFYLLDSYISYNERELNKKYIRTWKLDPNKKNSFYTYETEENPIKIKGPFFKEIIKNIGGDQKCFNEKIRKIRNAITHDFWMYLTDDEFEKEPKISEYAKIF